MNEAPRRHIVIALARSPDFAARRIPGAHSLPDSRSLPEVLRLLSREGADWNMVKLYSRKKPSLPLSRRPLGERHEIAVPYRVPNFSAAYGITKTAAAKLSNDLVPFSRPFDETFKFFWETNLRVSLV